MRLVGIALLSGMLAGCEPESAPVAPTSRSEPLAVTIRDAGPSSRNVRVRDAPKILKSDSFSVPRETSPLDATPPRPAPARAGAPDYRAIGTEPFWVMTVRGGTATLERPGVAALSFAVEGNTGRHDIRYRGDGFAMTISEGPCSDAMSDRLWSDRVQIAFADGTLKGCGGERDDRWKETR